MPRIIANNPKWLVSRRTDEFDAWDRDLAMEERAKKIDQVNTFAMAIRDYLTYVFDKQDVREIVKLWAKNMIRYWLWWVKVSYKYSLSAESYQQETEEYDELGNPLPVFEKRVKEDVVEEYPCIEVVNWKDIKYDPRYIRLEDMPCIIDTKTNVRLSFFTKNKKKYMNVDRLIDYCNAEYSQNDPKWYAERIWAITGISSPITWKVDKNNLTVTKYYGWYDLKDNDWKEEKLYEVWVVNGAVIVKAEEITQLPYEDIKCFEDTETHIATWFIEPILWLQDELNHKKNSASEYINKALNRSWIWSPNSWINPRQLIDAPNWIIPTTKSAQEALANLVELPLRQLPPQHFQEQNDFERQIQAMSFTIDTAWTNTAQSLTNTATWIKVKAFESNSVMNMIRENLEDWLTRLAYKFLQVTFDNIEWNVTIKKMDADGFWEINKEAMRDAIRRYDIRVETGSSSFDTEEQRRSDAIARWNISQQAASAGVPLDLIEEYKNLMSTWDWVDVNKLIKPQPMQNMPIQAQKPIQMPEGVGAEMPL